MARRTPVEAWRACNPVAGSVSSKCARSEEGKSDGRLGMKSGVGGWWKRSAGEAQHDGRTVSVAYCQRRGPAELAVTVVSGRAAARSTIRRVSGGGSE